MSKENPNCICGHYEYETSRKNKSGMTGKPYNLKVRSFRIGCPVHDKSLLTNPGVI